MSHLVDPVTKTHRKKQSKGWLDSPIRKTNIQFDPTVRVVEKKTLGQGAYGVVKLIQQGGRKYAVKQFTSGVADYNEIDVLARFEHPNLLHAISIFYTPRTGLQLTLPYATSGSLRDYMNNRNAAGNPIRPHEALLLFYQIASAVDFLNKQGYYHCDIKPENILMFGEKPVLADFGLSFPNKKEQQSINVCGTADYGAPQAKIEDVKTEFAKLHPDDQAKFASEYKQLVDESDDPAYPVVDFIQHDIYSLGCILFELVFTNRLLNYHASNGNMAFMYFQKDERIDRTNKAVFNIFNKRMNKYNAIVKQKHDNPRAQTSPRFEAIKKQAFNAVNEARLVLNMLKLVKKMCETSQRKRLTSMKEVLGDMIFSQRALSVPIPGRVLHPKINEDGCNQLFGHGNNVYMAHIGYLCEQVNDCLQTMAIEPFTLIFETMNLFLRCTPLIDTNKNTADIQHLLICCLYLVYKATYIETLSDVQQQKLVNAAVGEPDLANTDPQRYGVEHTNMLDRMSQIAGYVEGKIKSKTIVSVTDNALECLWFLCNAMQDCSWMNKNVSDVHYFYTMVEIKHNWMEKRIPMDTVLRFTFDYNINQISLLSMYKDKIDVELSTAFVPGTTLPSCRLSQVLIDLTTGVITRLKDEKEKEKEQAEAEEKSLLDVIEEENDEYINEEDEEGEELSLSAIDDLYEDAPVDDEHLDLLF